MLWDEFLLWLWAVDFQFEFGFGCASVFNVHAPFWGPSERPFDYTTDQLTD